MTRPFTAMLVVPTGLGAEVGGYAGDATPVANLLASCVERLITHPNVVNAASLYGARPNVRYVEGYALDRFCLDEWALREVPSNRVGLLVDAAIANADPVGLAHLLTAAEAVRSVKGVGMVGWRTTSEPVRTRIVLNARGASTGEVENPETLLAGARALVAAGAEAIALVARMPELPDESVAAYLEGGGPDPIGGLEAVLSHLVSRELRVPAAHAPYEPPDPAHDADPRVAAESVGYTFLPCVLEGLARAPRPIPVAAAGPWDLRMQDVDALVVPWAACGGIPALAALRRGMPVIAVRENGVACGADPLSLGLEGVLVAETYLEAAGLLMALRAGIAPETVRRPLGRLPRLSAKVSRVAR